MFARPLEFNQGLLFVESKDSIINSSIHMFFMRFDICVIWINHNRQVVDVRKAKKWRPIYKPQKPACYILETNVNQMDFVSIGDEIEFVDA